MYTDFGKVSSKKLLYIIALTSIFWFSMNILLLIANNEAARKSLEQLAFTSNERKDSHYMHNVDIMPLAAAQRNDLPWLNKDYWKKRENNKRRESTEKIRFSPGYREVYDISKNVNK